MKMISTFAKSGYAPAQKKPDGQKTKNLKKLMEKRLPRKILKFLKEIGFEGTKRNISTFIVGGFVRDLLLGCSNCDLDIVIEGDAINFACVLADKWNGKVRKHKKFGTAVIYLSDGFKIDIAAARSEYYSSPAALPLVKKSFLETDLYRRDFTINAMAVCLNKVRFGDLIDYFGGETDLKKGIIKCLHDLSFIDDPTRIFRAVRFEQRCNFKISRYTRQLIRTAVDLKLFDRLANQRVITELILIFSEDEPGRAVKRLAEFDGLRFIHPALKLTTGLELLFRKLSKIIAWFKSEFPSEKIENWSIYFLALLDNLTKEETKEITRRYIFSKKNQNRFLLSKRIGRALLNTLKKKRLKKSRIYYLLIDISSEVILFLMAKTDSKAAEKQIKSYLTDFRRIAPLIKGKDLALLGLKQGPVYKEIFRAVLCGKLDGRLKGKQDELNFIKRNYLRHRSR